MSSHPFFCGLCCAFTQRFPVRNAQAGRTPHTYQQPDRAPQSGGAAKRTGQKEPQTASKMTYHQKEPQTASASAQRPKGAYHLRGAYKAPTREAHQERREGARIFRAKRGAQPQRSEDAGGRRKGEKLTTPRSGTKTAPKGQTAVPREKRRGRADRADQREGSPPDRPRERQRGRERATEAPQGRTTRAAPTNELAREGAIRTNQTDTLQVQGRANSRKHEGRKQETQTKSAPSRRRAGPATMRAHREAARRSHEQSENHSRRRTRRRSGGGARTPATEPRFLQQGGRWLTLGWERESGERDASHEARQQRPIRRCRKASANGCARKRGAKGDASRTKRRSGAGNPSRN